MARPDTSFRTYLRAFCADLLTAMSGPLSVPFAALALYVSSRSQKVLFGCLAAMCAVFASYRVWRKERVDTTAQVDYVSKTKDAAIAALREEKDTEIAGLKERITKLSRKPYSEDLESAVNQLLDQMKRDGWLLLRHLLMHAPIEVGRPMIPNDVTIERQNEQMPIAMSSGIVRHEVVRHGSMPYTYYVINPQFKPVLERVLYERMAQSP